MEFRPLSYVKKLLSASRGGPVWAGGAGDIVLTLGTDGEILEISDSAIDVIGAAGNLIGRSIYDFVRREDRLTVKNAMRRAADKDVTSNLSPTRVEFRLLRMRRAPILAEISLRRPGRRGHLSALIRERGAELAQERTAKAVQEATPQTQVAPPSALLADLGHELKTPLNAIMGFAETMQAETFGPLGDSKYKEYAGHIHSSGAHLLDLISGMLDAAKIDAGRYELSPVLTSPDALVRECAAMVRSEAEKAGLTLVVSVSADVDDAMLDTRAVRQILINLLSNAVKFTAHGEVAISVSKSGGSLRFIVRDTGVGMSKIALAKIGARFTDVQKSGVRGTAGTGLGLSLAFALAKLHGGALCVDSAPGEGTVATLTLPACKSLAEFKEGCAPKDARQSSNDIQSQLDRVNAYRRERLSADAA